MMRERTMKTVTLAAVLAVGIGFVHTWSLTVRAQHGQASDPHAHFKELAERLELTGTQRETLAEPFHQAFEAMQELHRLHAVIAAELTDEQKGRLGEMIHKKLGGGSEGNRHPHHDESCR